MLASCFRGCLLRIPYATIISTLISTCGLIIGLTALFDATTNLDMLTNNLLVRNYTVFLNDLKVAYIFIALFIIIVIFFNLVIGFVATDQSFYRALENPSIHHRQKPGCCAVSCVKSSTAVCLLQTFLAFNYIIYYLLLFFTIVSFVGLFTTSVFTVLCRDGPNVNLMTGVHSRIPNQDNRLLDLRQFGSLVNITNQNETMLLVFTGERFQRLCSEYVSNILRHFILSTIGFLLASAGFVNYLINFSVNAAKLNTQQKFSELIYLNSETLPFDAKY